MGKKHKRVMVARSKVLHIFAHAESILTNSLYTQHTQTHINKERGEKSNIKTYGELFGGQRRPETE